MADHKFKVGDKVRVPADARTSDGGEVFFGGEVVGEVTASPAPYSSADVQVRADCEKGVTLHQVVAPAYLTKVSDDTISVEALKKSFVALGYEAADQDRILDVARAIEEASRG